MPTLTRTWTISQNNACADQTSKPAQRDEIALDIKNKLKTAGWTVTQSCDSSSTDTSDLCVNTGDLVSATSGAHSWIILRSPANYASSGKYVYFAIAMRGTSSSTGENRCEWAARGDADWTGLSTTSGPTDSATGVALWNNTTYNMNVVPSTLSDCKFHSCYSSTGDFIYYVSNSTGGQMSFAIVIQKCANADSSDLFPVAFYIAGQGSNSTAVTVNPFYHQQLDNSSNNQTIKCLHHSTGAGMGNSDYDSAIVAPGGASTNFILAIASSNTGDDVSGRIPLLPLYVASGTTNSKRLVGNLEDLWTSQGVSSSAGTYVKAQVGDVTPGTGSIQFGFTGCAWVPCSVAPDFS